MNKCENTFIIFEPDSVLNTHKPLCQITKITLVIMRSHVSEICSTIIGWSKFVYYKKHSHNTKNNFLLKIPVDPTNSFYFAQNIIYSMNFVVVKNTILIQDLYRKSSAFQLKF